MPFVRFTHHLSRFFPTLAPQEIAAADVAELVRMLDERYPGLADYLVDERGSLRKHVNIFVGSALIRDRQHLSDPLAADSEVFIMQALSGG